MSIKRFFLWGLPILAVISIIVFTRVQIFWSGGMNWFVPMVLMILWLAVYLNTWPGVLAALCVGAALTTLFGPPSLTIAGYTSHFFNAPLVITTLGGMVGGLIGGQLDRRHGPGDRNLYLNFILAIIGLIVGFVIGLWLWMGIAP